MRWFSITWRYNKHFAGSATWSSTLSITKGVKLIGAGAGQTVIATSGKAIDYTPSSGYWSGNYIFEVSGFTFNSSHGTGWDVSTTLIYLYCGCASTMQTNIKIHDNIINNSSNGYGAIWNFACAGVIYDNTFAGWGYPLRIGWGDNQCAGKSWPGQYTVEQAAGGDPSYSYFYSVPAQAMYVEDNTFNNIGGPTLSDGDQGGSYVFRYNLIDMGGQLFDMHENGRGGEIYGNHQTGGNGDRFFADRGGRFMVHHNYTSGTGTETNLYNQGCPSSTLENFKDTYYFQNRAGGSYAGSLFSLYEGSDVCNTITKNSTFWIDNGANCTSSNCQTGTGCGTTLPPLCTTGVGYWITSQSCSSLSGMVGVNPSTPISGTLYKCTATNTWTAYYTPYTYPHPLRLDVPAPMPPRNPRIVPQ